jgi:hypothetical protein
MEEALELIKQQSNYQLISTIIYFLLQGQIPNDTAINMSRKLLLENWQN